MLDFWFNKSTPEQWFIKNSDFDESLRLQFADTLDHAINGDLDTWMDSARSCLALIIVLDQFPRNLFRNNKRAFEQDPKALSICKHAIESNHINQLVDEERLFALLPLIHSENIEDHYRSEIAHFFQVYKELEGKKVEIIGWKSAKEAKTVIIESIKRYNDDLKKD